MKRIRALLPGLFGAIAASSCALGPDYHPAALPKGAEAPMQSADTAVASAEAPPDQWWHLYDDPALDGLVQQAFSANTDLREAEANLSAARALLEGARAGLYPSTTVEAGGIRGRDPTTNEILGFTGHRSQTVWLYDSVLDASYEVDLFGRVRRTIEASRAEAESVAAVRDTVKIEVAAEVARAYAQICALGEQIEVTHHSLDVVAKQLDITTRRRDVGAGTDFEVVRQQNLVSQVRATLPPLEGQRRAALAQLAVLLGKAPAEAPAEVLSCVQPPRLKSLVPIGDGSGMLKRRPDIREADRQYAAATARIGAAKADLYPRISFLGFYGGADVQFNSVKLGQLATGNGLVWGIGPSISWSFPNMAAPLARVHQADANQAAALANFDSVVLAALRETEQSLATYGSELQRRQALADAQDQAHRAYKLAQGQLDAGAVSPLDLLSSENTMVSADAAAAGSDAAVIQDQISVFKALGGGWELQDREVGQK
jgi:NodT family efflux transporter outer membrane factor (OMF) lipoprotein